MTWQEAAKGIPVWVGASIYATPGGHYGTAYQVGSVLVYGMYHKDASGFRLDWRDECVPDLSDPDTQAAYLRRLAVALGCPGDVASVGVTFQASGDGYECAAGRKITMDGDTFTPWRWHTGGDPKFAVADDRVAMALAWPADKRVRA